MLNLDQYKSVLRGFGYVETHRTMYAIEFTQEPSGRIIYINPKVKVPGLVLHPDHEAMICDLNDLDGVDFIQGPSCYRHNTNFRNFPKRINKKDPIAYGLEFRAESVTAARELLKLIETHPSQSSFLDHMKSFESNLDGISQTEREAMVKVRLGQSPWRRELDSTWGCCSLTGCDIRELLRGSHIKPWKDSSDSEKVDVHNGLLLRADIDALFDKGLISFLDCGKMLISDQLTPAQQHTLPFDVSLKIKSVPGRMKNYLKYHRAEIFKGAP